MYSPLNQNFIHSSPSRNLTKYMNSYNDYQKTLEYFPNFPLNNFTKIITTNNHFPLFQ